MFFSRARPTTGVLVGDPATRAHAQRKYREPALKDNRVCVSVSVRARARAGDGTEAHAPRRKITGVDLDAAPFADLLSDRAEGDRGSGAPRETGDQTPSRRDRRMETASAEEEEGS